MVTKFVGQLKAKISSWSRTKKILVGVIVVVLIGGGLTAYAAFQKNPTSLSIISGTRLGSTPTPPPQLSSFGIEITKIGISAPVVENVDGADKEAYLKALEGGVAHYKNTPLPGNPGNIFIFGHSGYWKNRPGNYKTIFETLDKLKKDDIIKVFYQQKEYLYTVEFTKTIESDDMSVLSQGQDEELTLMTCWPPKTVDKRLIVRAKRKT